jgi:gliding motility-associated-like protein
MKKALLAGLFCVISTLSLQAQNVVLFTDDFQLGAGNWTMNGAGPGTPTGTNIWTMNNNFIGAPTYNDNISQDSTYSGTIAFAPYSNNLHIYDQPTGITNCNYDPNVTSDQFTFMTAGVCTQAIDSVHFSFFYMCQGDVNAWGEVWYSANGGPWIQVGQLGGYNNRYKWQYEDIYDPAFAGLNDLRFGFRWRNTSGASVDSIAMAVDDIIIVGEYSGTATIVVDSVSPNPVCQGGFLLIYWHLTDTLCDGTYAIDLSGPTGIFNTANTWVANINNPQMSGVFAIILPTTSGPGNCYRVRIRRTAPPPVFTGIASGCFQIIACPNVITTLQPVVTFDTNAVCVGSAIDVPFYSTGVYGGSNTYTAQLSDSNGVFSATPPIIGSIPNSATYDPALGSPPGTVSGIVPLVPAGCGYYIRVVSSSPPTIGAPWGPFCIQHCDITTNNNMDLDFCVTDCAIAPQGADSLIDVDVNTYNTNQTYPPGNIFLTQLKSSMTFAQIGPNGILGSVAATGDTTLNVHIPCKDSLPIYGIPRGMNYMRVVASTSTYPDSALGSLIRVTIGAPNSTPPTITSYDYNTFVPTDTFCVGDIAAIFFAPYVYADQSTYMWTCTGINGGNPFVSPSGANSNSLYVQFNGAGTFSVTVQETSYGCPGPWSTPHVIVVLAPPSVLVTGPHFVCEGDTNAYQTFFMGGTYYSWTCNGGVITDTANNVIDVTWPVAGNYNITMAALNMCGSSNNTYTVTVNPYPTAMAGNDTTICSNSPVTLSTPPGSGYSYFWQTASGTFATTSSTVVTPSVTTTYYLITSIIGGCNSYDTVTVFVNSLADTIAVTNAGCPNNDGTASATPTGGTAPYTYLWAPGGQTTPIISNLVPGTYTCTITDASGCTYNAIAVVGGITNLNPDAGIDVTITQGDQTQLNGTGGQYYSWSPTAGLSCVNCPNPVASPTVTTAYVMTVSDSLGCTQVDTVWVFVELFCGEVFVPSAFSPNGDGQNDVLYVRGQCIETVEFKVFNRWGEMVFKTDDPQVGWDGVWRGVPCENAVFTYTAKGYTIDGNPFDVKGNVSLIK